MSNLNKEQKKLKVLVIDDEDQSHRVLRGLLAKDHPNVEIIGSGYSVQEGVELLGNVTPDLVFLDIEMPDGLGFDLLDKAKRTDFHVVFITAFDKYAVTAIKFGALDYLLKPIDREELAKAIHKIQEKKQEKISFDQLQILWNTLQNLEENKLPTRIAIPTMEGIHYKQINEIIRLEAKQNYTEFTLINTKKKILASTNLGEYEQQFELYSKFMRVHRSHLVNLSYVERFVKSEGGYLVMKDGAMVRVSKLCREELFDQLSRI